MADDGDDDRRSPPQGEPSEEASAACSPRTVIWREVDRRAVLRGCGEDDELTMPPTEGPRPRTPLRGGLRDVSSAAGYAEEKSTDEASSEEAAAKTTNK